MFNIVIVGGGPVGACAGALLARGTHGAAALSVALLEPRAPGAVPVAVTALAEGVIQMMWLARLKPLMIVLVAVILTATGVAVYGRQKPVAEAAPATPVIRAIAPLPRPI